MADEKTLINELTKALKENVRSVVVFIIQRSEVDSFSPNPDIDPAFAQLLNETKSAGVEIRAFACKITLEDISIGSEIPVINNYTSEKFHV